MVTSPKKTTICIDARFWGTRHTGIGRYVENLVDHLPEDPSTQIILIVSQDLKDEPKLARFKKFFASHHPYSVLSLFEMSILLHQIKPDLLHVPHITIPIFWPGKIIVTIHDLIKHSNPSPESSTKPSIIYWLKFVEYLAMFHFTLWRASHIIVPSKYWKDVLHSKYGLDYSRISVTYEGVDTRFKRLAAPDIDLPDHPYVLYVGNVYPHKNIPTLLSAIKELNGQVLLVIACARSVFTARLQKIIDQENLGKWVRLVGFVSDSELKSLYQNAMAFVFPSLIEGFGLPGLEAMSLGCPVISSNATCLPEIYGDSVLYFSPHDSHDLVDKIQTVLDSPSLRAKLIKKGLAQSTKYSWAKMGRLTWEIYQKTLH
ncbi:MAG: glycosyltransferase family 1 protein [Patescibacteria group bacterium]